MCLIIVLLFSQTWFLDGLIVPCRVEGGSMALTLLGMHRDVICADCGLHFFCDSTVRPVSPQAVCPNCGNANNNIESLPDLLGDRLLIDRSAFHFRRPRRWEIAAFRDAHEAGKILIKRVVGLPGESVQILGGDVYINGQIQRKTLDRQRSMAVLVYDANYSPTIPPAPPPRWQGENKSTLWRLTNKQCTHLNTTESLVKRPHPSPLRAPTEGWSGEGTCIETLPEGEGNIDWLVYHHWHRLPGRQDDVQECPITDLISYNQNLPRRQEDVHSMNDLLFSFRLADTSGRGTLFIRAVNGKDVFQVEIDPGAGTLRTIRNGNEIPLENNRLPKKIKNLEVVVSLIDRQFLLALNGRTVISLPVDDPVSEVESTSQPFAIGSGGLAVVLEDVRIYRDIYYTHPIRLRGWQGLEKPIQLGNNEYYVLGDNSSIAEDSRTWPARSVVDNLLIGKPLTVLFPAKSGRIGPWQFQVPDPSRIGYIR